jgi:hypothetical protein
MGCFAEVFFGARVEDTTGEGFTTSVVVVFEGDPSVVATRADVAPIPAPKAPSGRTGCACTIDGRARGDDGAVLTAIAFVTLVAARRRRSA